MQETQEVEQEMRLRRREPVACRAFSVMLKCVGFTLGAMGTHRLILNSAMITFACYKITLTTVWREPEAVLVMDPENSLR